MQQIFGGLMQLRIEADTTEKTLRTGEVPPLTQSQINHCMERVLIKHFGKGGADMCTKWDILNAMTARSSPSTIVRATECRDATPRDCCRSWLSVRNFYYRKNKGVPSD